MTKTRLDASTVDDFMEPLSVLTDLLSLPGGERNEPRGASGLYRQTDRPANGSAGVIFKKHSRRASVLPHGGSVLFPTLNYGQATVMSLSK
jgi:hypothetical protein